MLTIKPYLCKSAVVVMIFPSKCKYPEFNDFSWLWYLDVFEWRVFAAAKNEPFPVTTETIIESFLCYSSHQPLSDWKQNDITEKK